MSKKHKGGASTNDELFNTGVPTDDPDRPEYFKKGKSLAHQTPTWKKNMYLQNSTIELPPLVRHLQEQADVRHGIVFSIGFTLFFWFLLLMWKMEVNSASDYAMDTYMRRKFVEREFDTHQTMMHVTTVAQFWKWVRVVFVPELFPLAADIGPNTTVIWLDGINQLVKQPQLFQDRCRPDDCNVEVTKDFTPYPCYVSTEFNTFLGTGGSVFFQDSDQNHFWTPIQTLWAEALNRSTVPSREAVQLALDDLERGSWLSFQSCLITIQVWVYNNFYGVFTSLRVEFSVSGSGSVQPWVQYDSAHAKFGSHIVSVRGSQFETSDDGLRSLFEFIVFLVTIARFIIAVKRFYARRREGHFGDLAAHPAFMWALIDFFLYLFLFCALLLRVAQFLAPEAKQIMTTELPEQFFVGYNFEMHKTLNTIVGLLCVMCCFRFFHLFPRVRDYAALLWELIYEIGMFAFIFVLFLLVFAFVGWYYFGHGLAEFSTFRRSLIQVLEIVFLSGIHYETLAEVAESSLVPALFYFGLLITCYFVMLQMVFAVFYGAFGMSVARRNILIEKYAVPAPRTLWEWLEPLFNYPYVASERRILQLFEQQGWVEQVKTRKETATVLALGNSLLLHFRYRPQWKVEPGCTVSIVLREELTCNVDTPITLRERGQKISGDGANVFVRGNTITFPLDAVISEYYRPKRVDIELMDALLPPIPINGLLGQYFIWKSFPPLQQHHLIVQPETPFILDCEEQAVKFRLYRETLTGRDVVQVFVEQFADAQRKVKKSLLLKAFARAPDRYYDDNIEMSAIESAMLFVNRYASATRGPPSSLQRTEHKSNEIYNRVSELERNLFDLQNRIEVIHAEHRLLLEKCLWTSTKVHSEMKSMTDVLDAAGASGGGS